MDFIEEIENHLNIQAEKKMMPMQPGDVNQTWADTKRLFTYYKYKSNTSIKVGVGSFVNWYKSYYGHD